MGVSGFDAPARQLGLWDVPAAHEGRRLQETLDALRDRFGEQVIIRASRLLAPHDDEPPRED